MENLNLKLAEKALSENWGECYSSTQDMNSPEPTGTIEECEDEYSTWERIWCSDGTARYIYT